MTTQDIQCLPLSSAWEDIAQTPTYIHIQVHTYTYFLIKYSVKGNDHSHMSLLNKVMLKEMHDSKCTTSFPNQDPGLGQRKDRIRTREIYKLLWMGALQPTVRRNVSMVPPASPDPAEEMLPSPSLCISFDAHFTLWRKTDVLFM